MGQFVESHRTQLHITMYKLIVLSVVLVAASAQIAVPAGFGYAGPVHPAGALPYPYAAGLPALHAAGVPPTNRVSFPMKSPPVTSLAVLQVPPKPSTLSFLPPGLSKKHPLSPNLLRRSNNTDTPSVIKKT